MKKKETMSTTTTTTTKLPFRGTDAPVGDGTRCLVFFDAIPKDISFPTFVNE